MANVERMFQVIVLGGIALAVLPVPALVSGCGGSVAAEKSDGGDAKDAGAQDTGSFPVEGIAPALDSGFPQEGPARDSGTVDSSFPQEGLAAVDSGFGNVDSGFPQEGPAQIDSGSTTSDSSFPQEGPAQIDSGSKDANDDTKG